MWLCIRSGRQFEDTIENPHRGKVKQITNATNVILYARKQAIWEDIWKHTVGEIKQSQPVQLCIRSYMQFEETFEKA